MVKRLPVASDEISLHAKAALCGQDRIRVKLAQKKVKSRQVRDAGTVSVHCSKHGCANLGGIRILSMPQQFDGAERALAPAGTSILLRSPGGARSGWRAYLYKGNVDPVSGRPAHDSGDDHRAFFMCATAVRSGDSSLRSALVR